MIFWIHITVPDRHLKKSVCIDQPQSFYVYENKMLIYNEDETPFMLPRSSLMIPELTLTTRNVHSAFSPSPLGYLLSLLLYD